MTTTTATLSVGVLGARGHVGAELLPLLAAHPRLRLAACVSRTLAGRSVRASLLTRTAGDVAGCPADLVFSDLAPEQAAALDLDLWLLALPNGEAAPYVAAIAAHRADTLLIDLSADSRFDPAWVYGLPERNRAALRGARRIANPGCYATGIQLALGPLLDVLLGVPVAFGVSGYSGAGTTPSPRNDPERLRDNLMPYGLVGHLHEREASHHLGRPVRFLPHVAPFFRGITLTLSLELRMPHSAADLRTLLHNAYRDDPLIHVTEDIPLCRDAGGQHGVTLGGIASDGQRAALVVTLDNLLKGAATQAVQNLNLACGHDELLGVPL